MENEAHARHGARERVQPTWRQRGRLAGSRDSAHRARPERYNYHRSLHHRPPMVECSMTMPVVSNAAAMMRLRSSAAMRCARRAPTQAAPACAGAIDAHTATSMQPRRVGVIDPDASAAIIVAGRLTTMPAAAALPIL